MLLLARATLLAEAMLDNVVLKDLASKKNGGARR
jgi:hypothetical protein